MSSVYVQDICQQHDIPTMLLHISRIDFAQFFCFLHQIIGKSPLSMISLVTFVYFMNLEASL